MMDTEEFASHILILFENMSETEDIDTQVELFAKIILSGIEQA
jgi:hypothetical protein